MMNGRVCVPHTSPSICERAHWCVIVWSIATVWHGVANPPRSLSVRATAYKPGEVALKKGDEMGRFLLGSTVVMLWPKDAITFNEAWSPARGVRMGEGMGNGALGATQAMRAAAE
jgi:phosphatidylserine decarboxylase